MSIAQPTSWKGASSGRRITKAATGGAAQRPSTNQRRQELRKRPAVAETSDDDDTIAATNGISSTEVMASRTRLHGHGRPASISKPSKENDARNGPAPDHDPASERKIDIHDKKRIEGAIRQRPSSFQTILAVMVQADFASCTSPDHAAEQGAPHSKRDPKAQAGTERLPSVDEESQQRQQNRQCHRDDDDAAIQRIDRRCDESSNPRHHKKRPQPLSMPRPECRHRRYRDGSDEQDHDDHEDAPIDKSGERIEQSNVGTFGIGKVISTGVRGPSTYSSVSVLLAPNCDSDRPAPPERHSP